MNKKIFAAAIFAHIIGAVFFLAAVAYLGTFTRYMADDYCESYTTQTYSSLTAVVNRYQEGSWRAANRYSNLLFVGVMESLLGRSNIETVPAGLMLLWAAGLVVLFWQARKLAGLSWGFSVDAFFGLLLAFLPVLEAPNRFQTFYWRSSMATHFVPLVFLNFLAAFLLFRMRLKKETLPSVLTCLALFFIAFMIGGFSEPPVTVMIVGSGLSLAYIWLFIKNKTRRAPLILTGCVFGGAVSALTVMALSPAAQQLGETVPSFFEWAYRTTEYTFLFLLDAFKSLPLPILFSVVCPAVLVFLIASQKETPIPLNSRAASRLALALPLLLILLIAAGFSTSAYGQSYPVARARFFAHYFMTIVLVLEGVLLGIWLAGHSAKFAAVRLPSWAGAALLLALALYPVRAGLQTLQEAPRYREREQAWDKRDAHIYKLREQGQTDLTVPQFDGVNGVKELDTYKTHWVNICAAKYYGVNSIRAVPLFEGEIEAYYGY